MSKRALFKAIRRSDTARVETILANEPRLAQGLSSAWDGRSQYPLLMALEGADDATVYALERAGVSLIDSMYPHDNALTAAACLKRTEVVKKWVESYPNVWPAKSQGCNNILIDALKTANFELARWLIGSGKADPHYSARGGNALYWAEVSRDEEIIAFIKDHMPEAPQAQAPAVETTIAPDRSDGEVWRKMGEHVIVRRREDAVLGLRLTDVFNFAMGTCVMMQHDLQTNQQSSVLIDLGRVDVVADIETARAELLRRGGEMPPAAPSMIGKR